jgi:hypothetical protein
MHIVDSAPEFARYFTGTWIGRPTGKHVVPCYVNYINETTGSCDIREYNAQGTYLDGRVLFPEIIENYQLFPPMGGNVNFDQGYFHVSTTPKRHSSKGFSSHRLTYKRFGVPHGDVIYRIGEWIWRLYNPTYVSIEQALGELRTQAVHARAISHDVGLENANSGKIIVRFQNTIIGSVIETKINILSQYSLVAEIFNNTKGYELCLID